MVRKISAKEIKDHPNEDVKQIADDLDKASAISALSQTEGGQLLVDGLVSDIVACVDSLTAHYKKLSIQEFVGTCADMKTKIDLLRAITHSKANKKALEELLEDAIKM